MSGNAKIVLPVVLVVLLLLASPVLGVRLGLADSGTAPKDQTTRKAYDLLSTGFGPGFTEPIPVVIDLQSDHAAADKLDRHCEAVPGITQVDKPIYNKKNHNLASVAIINTYGKYKPQDSKTDDLVSNAAAHRDPADARGIERARVRLGLERRLHRHRQPDLLARAVVPALHHRHHVPRARDGVPLCRDRVKAALTTLLSALVGFGVLTVVVQQGHGMGLIGLDRTGPIESFVPPIAFAILFGLSMDYEVFLMSRIREEHVHGDDTVTAVKDGVAGVGRVIVAAALIMSSVFFSFLLAPDRVSKEFGLLLGVAILTDALLMRMTLVPALLTVLGERSWAIPAWLEKLLPNITIESPAERGGRRRRHRTPCRLMFHPADAEAQVQHHDVTRRVRGRSRPESRESTRARRHGAPRVALRDEGVPRNPRPRRRRRRDRAGRPSTRPRGTRTSVQRSWGGTCSGRCEATG